MCYFQFEGRLKYCFSEFLFSDTGAQLGCMCQQALRLLDEVLLYSNRNSQVQSFESPSQEGHIKPRAVGMEALFRLIITQLIVTKHLQEKGTYRYDLGLVDLMNGHYNCFVLRLVCAFYYIVYRCADVL